MNRWTRGAAEAALVTVAIVGFSAAAVNAANADDTTSGNGSLLGGNQANLPISIPINASGNAISAGGYAAAASSGGAHVVNDDDSDGSGMHTSGNFSAIGGNQINAPISVPVNVCGNAATLLGVAKAACKGSATVHNHGHGHGMHTSGDFSLVGGNQINAPVSVPVNVCGNAVSVAGVAKAACKGSATVRNGRRRHHHGQWVEAGRLAHVSQSAERRIGPVPAAPGFPSLPSVPRLPGLSGGRTPISLLPGIGGSSAPLAQTQLPLLSQPNAPVSLGTPLQPSGSDNPSKGQTPVGLPDLTNPLGLIGPLLGK